MVTDEYYVIKAGIHYLTVKELEKDVYKCTYDVKKAMKFIFAGSARIFLENRKSDKFLLEMNNVRIVKVTTNEEDL